MLEAIQHTEYRNKAQKLYDMVYAPDVKKYTEKFQSDDRNLAHDAAGTVELFDDWDLPYETHLNQVKFNNHIHHQMDYDVTEDF